MAQWGKYYQQGGLIRVGLKAIEATLGVAKTLVDAMAREHRFWNEYPLSLRHRLRAYRHGFLSSSYVLSELDKNNPDDYLSDYIQGRVIRPAVNSTYTSVLENKVAFHLSTNPYLDCVPMMFGTIESGEFFSSPTADSKVDVIQILERERDLIVKPVAGTGGTGVRHLKCDDNGYYINGQPVSQNGIIDLVERLDGYLITEFVHQHDYSMTISPESVNSIRVLTIKDADTGEMFIPAAIHRFGSTGGAPTDNWHSGGFAAPIDIDTGELNPLVRYSPENGLQQFEAHPETGARVYGTSIPHWDAVKQTAINVANIHRQNPYVGWDIVVTTDGPVVIEGNCAPHSEFVQLGGGLFKNERVRRAFKEFTTS